MNGKHSQHHSLLGGVGFYLLLLLCLSAVGVAGYYAFFGVPTELVEPASQAVLSPAPLEVEEPVIAVEPMIETVAEPLPVTIETPVEEIAPEEPQVETVETKKALLVVAPLRGETLTAFHADELCYNETLDDWRTHDGIDIAADAGTQVLAACAGTVLGVMADDSMGTTVVISHEDGYQTVYANLQAVPTVAVGETVSAGDVIGAVGETSLEESALAPHLHFAVSLEGTPVSPEEFLQR